VPLQVLPEGNEKDENKKSLNILLSYEPMASFPMKILPKFPVLTPCPYWGVSRPIAGSIAKYYPLAGCKTDILLGAICDFCASSKDPLKNNYRVNDSK